MAELSSEIFKALWAYNFCYYLARNIAACILKVINALNSAFHLQSVA